MRRRSDVRLRHPPTQIEHAEGFVDLESAHKAHERSQATLATLRAERAECAAKLDAAGTRIDQLKYEEL
jgi:hypothetical protein